MGLTEDDLKQFESWLILKDGREVFVRPIKYTDGTLIVDLFNRLSARSKHMRFLRVLREIPEDMLHRFTHPDYSKEFGLAATVRENGEERIVGVSRYACFPGDDHAEIGLTVRDDWQNIGLGKVLFRMITEIGVSRGIGRFGGLIDLHNIAIRTVLQESGYDVRYIRRGDVYQVEITERLPCPAI